MDRGIRASLAAVAAVLIVAVVWLLAARVAPALVILAIVLARSALVGAALFAIVYFGVRLALRHERGRSA